jgi:hypothetical protein
MKLLSSLRLRVSYFSWESLPHLNFTQSRIVVG